MVADKPLIVNAIAERFDVSRQAISLHIKILIECELLKVNQRGRERYCEAQLGQLGEVSGWVAKYKQHWESKLDALETYLDQVKNQENMESKAAPALRGAGAAPLNRSRDQNNLSAGGRIPSRRI